MNILILKLIFKKQFRFIILLKFLNIFPKKILKKLNNIYLNQK